MLYLVTGAAAGLGRALALELAGQRHQLILCDLDGSGLDATAAKARERGAEVEAIACDLTEERALEDAVLRLPEAWQAPDVVIANAGLAGVNPGYAFSRAVDRRIMAVNYDGVVHTLMPFVPKMIARRSGALVAISSLAGLRGLPNASSYCASKAAVTALVESLRVDLRRFGISVCSVHPGFLRSRMTDHQEFAMPFLLDMEDAARRVLRAIRRRRRQIYFPWLMGLLSRLNRVLPNWLADWAAERIAGPADKQARIFSGR